MGCGGSKGSGDGQVTNTNHHRAQDTGRMKTPSMSSSSGVYSYRNSQSLQQTDRPGSHNTRDLNQNKEEEEAQVQQQDGHQDSEEQRLAEQQKRDAEAEEQRRLQEEARVEEERRHQEQAQAEEVRRQAEARQQEEVLSQQKQAEVFGLHVASGGEQGNWSRTFTPQEIAQHNADVGWKEWIPYKGKVYDGNGFKAHFPNYMNNREAMLEARAQQRVAEGGEEEEKEFITYMKPLLWDGFPPYRNPNLWKHNGVMILRIRGISEEELARELPPFLLGTIPRTPSDVYFDSIRKDVSMLLEALRAPSDNTQPSGLQQYMEQLMRWEDKYRVEDPSDQSPASEGRDPNEKSFPLPAVDPESFRLFLLDGERMDFEIPPEGVWHSYETEEIDLGDPHEIFTTSLRVGYATEELVFEVDGEAAWEVLSDDAVKEDLMTPKQQEIQAARDKRTDLNDLERMRKCREQLCDYFIETRELAPAVVMPFLQWASLLEASQAQLDQLCEE